MPLPKVKPGQSQADYMASCMHEAFGDDAPESRTQEQAVAMCMSAWRDAKGEPEPKGKMLDAAIASWVKHFLAKQAKKDDDEDDDEKKPNGNGKDKKKPPKFASDKEKAAEIARIIAQFKKLHNRAPRAGFLAKVDILSTPVTPAAGENEDAFIDRCVEELCIQNSVVSEADAEDACQLQWDDFQEVDEPGQTAPAMAGKSAHVERVIARWKEKFGKDPTTAIVKQIEDAPEPEEGMTREEYMEECLENIGEEHPEISDEDAQDACELAWEDYQPYSELMEERAKGLITKTHASTDTGMEFILSDATPDRFGDVVEPGGWDFKNFNRNPIALFNHHPDWIVGSWKNLRADKESLRGNLVLAPKGTSPRIDEIRGLVEAGILRAVSVGFKPLESRPVEGTQPHKLGPFGGGGMVYTKSELVETSLVSIPANPNALAVAKSLHVSPETMKLVFGEHANKRTSDSGIIKRTDRAEHGRERTRAITAEHGKTRIVIGGQSMLLAQRIEAAEKHLVGLRDQLQEHLATVDDQNPDDAGMAVTEDLNGKIKLAERGLENLRNAEQSLATRGERGNGSPGLPAVRQVDSAIADRMAGDGPRPFGMAPKKFSPIDYLIRQGIVEAYAHAKRKTVEEARQQIYGNDQCTRAYIDFATKAASAQAMTTVTGWAAELVQQVYGDFLQILVPTSVMPNLANMGLALTFGRAGRIVIPSRTATPSLAGSFVGEGQAIPVRQGAFTTQTLTPKKLGVITTWTREMDEHSIPAIEGVLRDSVAIDTGIAIDNVLMDANAATVIRPAGLRSGVAGLTPTAGGGFNALVGDIKQLAGALLTATAGHIRRGVFLMNPQQTLSISLIQPPAAATPLFPFEAEIAAGRLRSFKLIESGNVPLGMVIALDAADFVTVGAEAPRFEVSDQATLHFEDTAPTDITGGTPSPAVPVRSMFQTDSIALRLVWPLNWTLRRLGMVSWVTGVTW